MVCNCNLRLKFWILARYYRNLMRKHILLLLILTCAQLSWAQQRFRGSSSGAKTTKIGLTYANYTGPDYTSFSKGSPSYGIEASIDDGGSYLRYFFKAGADYANGTQPFSKNNIVYTSKYEFFSISPEIGLILYPVAKRNSGLNIYLFGFGQVSYNYLNIMTIPNTVTGVNSKSQEFGAGYGGGLGIEYNMSASAAFSNARESSASKSVIYAELGFCDSYAPLAGQNRFELSSIKGTVGYGF